MENTEAAVNVTFYTDPLCCWSWALEKPWRQFIADYGAGIRYNYVLCGMIPDWATYRDDMNAISKPLQMGPVWMHASEVTHVPMKYGIWHEDAPASSYPACIAVKTAGLQSRKREELYLLHVRKSLMEKGVNIARPAALLEIAKHLDGPDFSYEQFRKDWNAGRGQEAFRLDLKTAKLNNIGRYPTLTFQRNKGQGLMIIGYRPYEALVQAFEHFKTI